MEEHTETMPHLCSVRCICCAGLAAMMIIWFGLSARFSFSRHSSFFKSLCQKPLPSGVELPRNTKFMPQCSPPIQTLSARKRQRQQKKKKVILFYNRPHWMTLNDSEPKACRLSDACTITDDRTVMGKADAVVVDVSRLGDPVPPSAAVGSRRAGQVWVALGLESPLNFWGQHDSSAWRSVFNWTMSYRTDSDIFFPYGSLFLRSADLVLVKNYTRIALNKSKPVAWLVSNCQTYSKREDYVAELKRHIQVDVFGHCGPFSCPNDQGHTCMDLLTSSYFFYLSFENSLCVDYVTEKLFKLYGGADVIPVTRGGADYDDYFPLNTFINAAHFRSPRHLATRLRSLMADLGAYSEMLRLKDRFVSHGLEESLHIWRGLCQLCGKLGDLEERRGRRTYADFMKWFRKDMCRPPQDLSHKYKRG